MSKSECSFGNCREFWLISAYLSHSAALSFTCHLMTSIWLCDLVQFSPCSFYPRLPEVCLASNLKRFQCFLWLRQAWPSHVLSRKTIGRFLCPRLSPPGDRWYDIFDFSRKQFLKLLNTSNFPASLSARSFSVLRHIQDSTPTGV